jgi:hypothetical protein
MDGLWNVMEERKLKKKIGETEMDGKKTVIKEGNMETNHVPQKVMLFVTPELTYCQTLWFRFLFGI